MRYLTAIALVIPLVAACSKQEPVVPSAPPAAAVPDVSTQAPPAAAAPAPVAAPEAVPTAAPAAAAGTYVVVAGDTLYGIAAKHGVSHKDLARWNGIKDPRRLRVGQELRLSRQ